MTNRMYIPEIGDHIRLTKDWTFELHAEGRNEALANFFGYRKYGGNSWIEIEKIEEEPPRDYVINYPTEEDFKKMSSWGRPVSYEKRQAAYKQAEAESESYQAYLKAFHEWNERAKQLAIEKVVVTLPKDTVLAIDRIYIRKGASDFSSITFYAKGMGETEVKNRWSGKITKWKAQRFWAKLQDCNQIEFELMEEKEVISVFKVTKRKN